jgi:uncharacterized protein YndB with AHSA1/START domain
VVELEASTIIDAPVEKVWEFLADFDTAPQWGRGISKVEYKRPVGVGTTIVFTARLMGERTLNMTITDWMPGHKFAARSTLMGSRIDEVWSLEPVEGGRTRLTKSTQVKAGGIMRLLWPFISGRTKRLGPTQLGNVKRILEAKSKTAV